MRRPWIALLLIFALLFGQTGEGKADGGLAEHAGTAHVLLAGEGGSGHHQHMQKDCGPTHCCGSALCSQQLLLIASIPVESSGFSKVRHITAAQTSDSLLLAHDPPVPKPPA